MCKKVLFVDTAHPSLQDKLEAMGFQCDYFPDYQYADYLRIIADYAGIIIRSKIPVDSVLLDAASRLRFVGRVGAGMENIDYEYAHKKGIVCLNAPEGNRDAVAEQAIGMLLMLFNNLLKADAEVRKGIWLREENRGVELMGKTVAIIGYGNTGSAFAGKLSGFEAKVIAYDKYKSNFGSSIVEEVCMQKVFEMADIVSLHVPLTKETTYLVNSGFLESFRKPVYIINTSRGKVLNTADLLKAMDQGRVLGACLDVLEFEKTSFEALSENKLPAALENLIQRKNLVLSPHIAGWTHESNLKMAKVLAAKIGNIM